MKRSRQILGFFAHGLPLVATLLVVGIIVAIIANFLIGGLPALSWEFLTESPRNVNTEGGIFPAIYGTVLLVIIMTIAAVPIGTITAIYLAEYAKKTSKLAQFVRFAVNTLAGVPSIVFGLFGLGFFIQTIGGGIDNWNHQAKMAELQQLVAAAPSPIANNSFAPVREIKAYLTQEDELKWRKEIQRLNQYEGGESAYANSQLVVTYLSSHTDPNWGKGNILWAALTLSLLTLPVVIVAVEEALKAVPQEVRSASLALGATRLETVWKIVLPNSLTGILTGSILAVGRGAGEVAPILFTGAAFSLAKLPGLQDQFMHLGFHLYILSTQAVNIDQARPLQFATTIVLLGLTLALNAVAIVIRSRIRRKNKSN
ncbi:MAG: ABC transporter permease subunit [Ignavibacteriae bacterium]|nr:ABC transporter permease subunit [Ignavibacteriota bacterium]MCB9217024.1 ABC transporter permease subunit [Ignavibacteria bacterium]